MGADVSGGGIASPRSYPDAVYPPPLTGPAPAAGSTSAARVHEHFSSATYTKSASSSM